MRRLTLPILAVLAAAAPAPAHEHAPRVISPRVADTYSLKTFARFPRWRDLEGDAKAWEIFRYLADPRTGIYPMGVPAIEGDEELTEYSAVRNPVKMLNVYPIGHCGTLGPTMAGIWEGMGLGPARTLVIPGWGHVASEVFYGGKWHYLDLDVRAAFRRPGGELASMDEARSDPAFWERPSDPLFFPLDPVGKVREVYARTAVERRYGVHTGGHTMDFILRRGETLKRWWKPQGGRWNHHPSYAREPFPRRLLEQEPRGPKCKHESFTIHTHGNGRFIYRPDLSERSGDFEDGVLDSLNVRPGPAGLTLAGGDEGHAIFEVRTPWVIAPLVGDLDDPGDDREASVVAVDGSGASLAISLDGGLSWEDLGAPAGAVDLTSRVRGRYGYLLRLALRGRPGEAFVRSLEIVTWVQLHPASLPALGKGINRMEYLTGDHHGLPSHVIEISASGGDREAFLRRLAEPPPDYEPARRTRRAIGDFTVKVEAPPRRRIAWFSAGGAFCAHQGEDAPGTRNAMAWAAEGLGDFRTFWTAAVPAGNAHWHTNADVEVMLERPEKAVLIRYTGDPGVNAYRIYAHCIADTPCPPSRVIITHAWKEGGILKTKEVSLAGPGAYEIAVEGDPEDEWIEIACPGGAAENPPVTTPVPWAGPMRRVHARFKGRRGTFACFGDSITVSMAFWASLRHARRNLGPEATVALKIVDERMLPECWDRWKGPAYGNEGSMTIRWARENIDRWLEKLDPEVALIMFGTNDLHSVPLEEYEQKTREVIVRCLENGTVPILSTIPPRSGMLEKSKRYAEAARRVARELKVPLCDYFEECLRRRPEDWDGAAEKFKDYEGYEVPTLISRDGVHPSNPRKHAGDYSDEGLRSSGFVLRNHVSMLSYAEVIRQALAPAAGAKEAQKREN